jgi:outer membrane protein OmpA-like peptidoglycan-associated protein
MTDQWDHVEGTMAHDTDKILTRRASLAVVGGLVLLPLVETLQAAEQPNAQQILETLQKPTSDQEILKAIEERPVRASGETDLGRIKKEQDLIKEISRRQIRSVSEADRDIIWKIARYKPKIDLEVNFDFDSAVMNSKAVALANELGQALVQLSGTIFLVGGHTDGQGSDVYNLDLSRRRAEAIKAYLVETFRVPAANLIAVGYGKERLKNPGNPFADENRRVQVVNILKPE